MIFMTESRINQQIFDLFTEEGRWRLVPMGACLCGITLVLLGLNVLLRVKVFGDAAWGTIMTLAGLTVTTIMAAIFFSENPSEGNEEPPKDASSEAPKTDE